MSLEAFGVKNLRCLKDTGLVPIRPITVLVGRNSSGKSTFLRAFPLLRQSVGTRRNTPILWYGDEHPVDFGSLRDAASAWLSEPSVTFMFRLRLPEGAYVAIGDPAFDVEVTLAGGEIPHVSEYAIRVERQEVHWGFNEHGRAVGLTVNGKPVELPGALSLGGKAHLLPTLQPGEGLTVTYSGAPDGLPPGTIEYQTRADDLLLGPVVEALSPLFHGNASKGEIERVAGELLIGDQNATMVQVRSISNHKHLRQQVLRASVGLSDENVEIIKDVTSRVLVRCSPYVVEAADLVLSDFMSRVAYLAPLRVTAQRAYRISNLAIDEVDPDGKNLAMFLRSLSSSEAESFAAFTQHTLGFETRVKTTGMHAEILVRASGSQRFANLVDVGFGYSEVLPLAAVLWNSSIRPTMDRRAAVSLIAVEQPELHLHPAHQARLARMLVEAVAASNGARVVVETHSESLINGLGKLVYDGVIKPADVQLVLFDQDEESEQTTVRLAGYRESGALHDWPYGFLSPVAERRAPAAAAE